MRISEKLQKIENDFIKYKAATFSTADTSPLYRKSIRFEPFGDGSVTRYYTIKLIFDAESPIIESSQSYLLPVISGGIGGKYVPLSFYHPININNPREIKAYGASNFTVVVTIFSSAEIKGYEVTYIDR